MRRSYLTTLSALATAVLLACQAEPPPSEASSDTGDRQIDTLSADSDEVPSSAVTKRANVERRSGLEATSAGGESDPVGGASEIEAALANQPQPPLKDPLNASIWIEGGTFPMGLGWLPGDEPVHTVTVSGFWIQQHKVTNEEFRRFGTTPTFSPGDERHPVVGVTWQEAMDYATTLGGTLPTEAQFEFSARGTEGRLYPWGSEYPDCERAHFSGCEPETLIDVMSHPLGATPDSVHGLASIVYEMARDWYGPYGPEPLIDPVGPTFGEDKVLRGGGIGSGAGSLYSANRGRSSPGSGSSVTGFRVVWEQRQGPKPGEQSGIDEVTTVDALAALALTQGEIQDPYARIIRSEGMMHVCAAGGSYEVRVVKGRQAVAGACEAFPVERVSQEGSFPYADLTIDGTAYRANEVHLMRRAKEWFLFIEGGHDQSVTNEHYGVVFEVFSGDQIQLLSRCSGHVQANDEDSYELYRCIHDGLPSLDIALVKWEEDDSCSIDYSFCPTAPA